MPPTEHRQLLRAFDEAPVGLALTDAEGRFVRANRAFTELVGRPPEQLAGVSLDELTAAEDATTARDVRRLALEGSGPAGRAAADLRLAGADGEQRWASVSLSVLPDEPGGMLVAAQDIDARKRHEDDLRHRALHDPLTGLANRSLLLDRLEHALERRQRARCGVAVLFVDIDGFKAVNDTHGHAAGDAMLVGLGERLQGCLRHGDTVARIGGDEFVVLCEDVIDEQEVGAVVARVRAEAQRPLQRWDGGLPLAVSIGAALAERREPTSPETLLRRADAAMYADKAARRAARSPMARPTRAR